MIVTKSARQEICWQNGGNMLAGLVTVTKSASWEISFDRNGRNVLADLVIVIKSTSQEICWQKWGRGTSAGIFSGLSSNLSVRKYAGRKLQKGRIYWQIQ